MTAMLLKSRQLVSNVHLLTQYWLPNWSSLTRTLVGETPVSITECSANEYRMLRPSHAIQVRTAGLDQRASIQIWTGCPAASSAYTVAGESPSPPYALGTPCERAMDRITG